jgi:PAS domain-containing protein
MKKGKNKSILKGATLVHRAWLEGWTYIKTVVDIVREPILLLDKDFRIMGANGPFYATFKVEPVETEGKVIYKLGNGQWDIPALRKLLEDILPKHTFFKGFEVSHKFPTIGHKKMILNARQIYVYIKENKKTDTKGKSKKKPALQLTPPIILLAIEDITEMTITAERLADHVNQLEGNLMERTKKIDIHVRDLEEEIKRIVNNNR